MRTYLYCEAGFVEKAQWLPNSWVNVVCPNNDDFEFLTKTLNVPESFLDDIADTDERPRTDTEGNWLLTAYPCAKQAERKPAFRHCTYRHNHKQRDYSIRMLP